MNVVRIGRAPSYAASGHDHMSMVRLQGREAGPTDTMWLACHALPRGGGMTPTTSVAEQLHVVWAGEVTIFNGAEHAVRGQLASARIAGGRSR